MDSGINVNLIQSQQSFFFSKKEINFFQERNTKKKTIRLFDTSCKDYINISQKLFKISESFYLYEKVEFLEPTEIDSDFVIKHNFSKVKVNKYVLFTYSFQEKDYFPFISLLKKLVKDFSPTLFFSIFIQSYSHLLDSLHKVSCLENPICLLSISSSTILFNKEYIPIFFCLENSFSLTSKINGLFIEKTMNKILNLNNFSLQPIEVHLLFYLYKTKSSHLSISDLVEVIHHYIKSMPFFSLFTKEEKEKYKEISMESLKSLVSLEFATIFTIIINKWSFSWDNYALSILYFHILEKINTVFLAKEFGFFKEWYSLLKKNVITNNREKVEYSRKVFEKLLVDNPHWLSIANVDKEKMDLLINVLH